MFELLVHTIATAEAIRAFRCACLRAEKGASPNALWSLNATPGKNLRCDIDPAD